MRINPVKAQPNSDQKVNEKAHHVFVFLEVFAPESGIQSYVKDILPQLAQLAQDLGVRVA
jgi:hypothetical protein